MKYYDASIELFVEYIYQNDLNIILFGAGAVCKTFIPYIAAQYQITDRIRYVVDNNLSKQGQTVVINEKVVPIVKSDIFLSTQENYCILITNGDFYSVIRQLNEIEECKDKVGFIVAYMQLDRIYDKLSNKVFLDFEMPQIPKIIHYCWFSGKPIPKSLEQCIQTWKEVCPDYEIIRWDESNFDVKKYRYTQEAYEMGKWGFIPDIVRLEKLYEIGGFYFDTDVKIIKKLDNLRYQRAFCGRERAGHVNFGGGSGAVPGNEVIKELLDFRKNEIFKLKDGLFNAEASGYYETTPLMKKGLLIEDINQKLDGINIYASEFFSPYNYINGEEITNDNTYSIHYFSGSWIVGGNELRRETKEKYLVMREEMEKL